MVIFFFTLLVVNDTPHSSLDDITPSEAIYDEKKRVHVVHLNIQKG
jgi:hypothetical protein